MRYATCRRAACENGTVRAASIVGAAESAYTRHPDDAQTTHTELARAARLALTDAGIEPAEVDGLGVASFTLAPDRGIDLAVRLGLRLRWLMDAGTGGNSGIDMLQHAIRAVEAGDANSILLVAGDVFRGDDFRTLIDTYNVATRDHLAPIPTGGPNAIFALLTQRHMRAHGLERADYGRLVVAQRTCAGGNPGAVYRSPLTMADYLGAATVAEPLCLFDCVPVVAGADALVVSSELSGVRVRSLALAHNFDRHEGDGLSTGVSQIARSLWSEAGAGPSEMDVVSVYDDYPAMALIQLADLGFGEPRSVLSALEEGRLHANTSGGQLSAGQAGAAGGMHGLVELVTQLRGRAGERQVEGARLAVATGYGMVAYRYGASAGGVVLEAAA
jgi:acetyl-CoA acetyltransferase